MLTFFNEIFLSFRFVRFFFEVWQKVFVSNVNVPKIFMCEEEKLFSFQCSYLFAIIHNKILCKKPLSAILKARSIKPCLNKQFALLGSSRWIFLF